MKKVRDNEKKYENETKYMSMKEIYENEKIYIKLKKSPLG